MHHLATNVLLILAIVSTSVTNLSAQAIIPTTDEDGEWFLKFRYGSGAPKDAGPLGHCTATITKCGKVRIVSKGRRGVAGPKDAIYEKDALDEKELKAIFNAAEVAFAELFNELVPEKERIPLKARVTAKRAN